MKRLEEEEARTASLAEEAKQKAQEVGSLVDGILVNKAKDIAVGFSWENIGSQLANAVKTANNSASKVQIATVRGQAKARNLPAQKAVVKQTKPKPEPKSKSEVYPSESEEDEKAKGREVKNIFGGLFKQETIYVDDDWK